MATIQRPDVFAEDCFMDIGELAKIFQALKYRIHHYGAGEPSVAEETASEPATGIRITVTCLKSRQQVVLLRDSQDCSCSHADEDKGFWEVVATSGSRSTLVETTCGLYPPLKADAAAAVRRLMDHVVALAAGRMDPAASAAAIACKWNERRNGGWQRLSLGAGEERRIALPELTARYRSLDTLIDKDVNAACADLPKPGALLKPTSSSCFDAGHRSVSDSQIAEPATSPVPPKTPPSKDQLLDHLRAAQGNLSMAIAICETRATKPTESRVAEVGSCPKLSGNAAMPPPKGSELPRTRVVMRPGSVTPRGDKAPITSRLAVPKETGATKKISGTSAGTSTKNKYAHVKSTISKITKPSPKH